MDDRIFFGVLAYFLVTTIVIGILPSEFFSGSRPELPEIEDGIDNPESVTQQLSFITNIVKFLFAPFSIDGIPVIIGLIIFIINIGSTLVAVIYIYDKIRGIGS